MKVAELTSKTFRIKQLDARDAKGKKTVWVRVRGEIAEFSSRQKARQFCRNNALSGPVIVFPDGHEERFSWKHDSPHAALIAALSPSRLR